MSKPTDLLSPENDDCFRVKQATKQGYILCKWGGVVIYHIRPLNSVEVEYRATVR